MKTLFVCFRNKIEKEKKTQSPVNQPKANPAQPKIPAQSNPARPTSPSPFPLTSARFLGPTVSPLFPTRRPVPLSRDPAHPAAQPSHPGPTPTPAQFSRASLGPANPARSRVARAPLTSGAHWSSSSSPFLPIPCNCSPVSPASSPGSLSRCAPPQSPPWSL